MQASKQADDCLNVFSMDKIFKNYVYMEQEKKELEEQRVALMEEVQSYRRRIKQLEDDLLFRLSNSQVRSPRKMIKLQIGTMQTVGYIIL